LYSLHSIRSPNLENHKPECKKQKSEEIRKNRPPDLAINLNPLKPRDLNALKIWKSNPNTGDPDSSNQRRLQ